jgi:hypothetical protein
MRGCVSWRHSSPTAAPRARGCECNGRPAQPTSTLARSTDKTRPAQLTNTPRSRRCGQALRHGRGGGGGAFAHDLLHGAAGHHGGHGRNGHAAAHGARAGTQGAVSRVRGVAGAHARAIHGAAHCTAPIFSPTSPTSPDLCSSTAPRSLSARPDSRPWVVRVGLHGCMHARRRSARSRSYPSCDPRVICASRPCVPL